QHDKLCSTGGVDRRCACRQRPSRLDCAQAARRLRRLRRGSEPRAMTALLPRPRALLFDWDNTLVDSWDTIHAALVVPFEAMGHEPWTMAEAKLRVARSLRDSFPALFGERWEEARQLYLDTFTAIHLERLKPIEGAEALLGELAAARFYLG